MLGSTPPLSSASRTMSRARRLRQLPGDQQVAGLTSPTLGQRMGTVIMEMSYNAEPTRLCLLAVEQGSENCIDGLRHYEVTEQAGIETDELFLVDGQGRILRRRHRARSAGGCSGRASRRGVRRSWPVSRSSARLAHWLPTGVAAWLSVSRRQKVGRAYASVSIDPANGRLYSKVQGGNGGIHHPRRRHGAGLRAVHEWRELPRVTRGCSRPVRTWPWLPPLSSRARSDDVAES